MVNAAVDTALLGLQMHVRMTGCPNGCARPYMAELGLVGDGPNSYQLYLGGSANQTRLAEVYMERMKMQVRVLDSHHQSVELALAVTHPLGIGLARDAMTCFSCFPDSHTPYPSVTPRRLTLSCRTKS